MRKTRSRVVVHCCFLLIHFIKPRLPIKPGVDGEICDLKSPIQIFFFRTWPQASEPILLLNPGGLCWLRLSSTYPPSCHGDSWVGGVGLDSVPHIHKIPGPYPSLHPLHSPHPSPHSAHLHPAPPPEFSISWPLFVFAFVSLFPLDGFLFVSELSGALHHGDSVLGCP